MTKKNATNTIRPVAFDWSETCIDEFELQIVLDAYLNNERERKKTLCAAANIGCIADTRGLRCPFPVRELRNALTSLAYGQRVILLTDDPVAKIDIPHAVMQDNNYLRVRIGMENTEVFLIEKS